MNSWKLRRNIGSLSNYHSDGIIASFGYPCTTNYDCTYYESLLQPGLYKFEVWGAQGGGCTKNSVQMPSIGTGGYSVGVYKISEATKVFVFVGGKGEDARYPAPTLIHGGFNGGGDVTPYTRDDDDGGAGGGSSDIRVGDIEVDSRVIVAGGGAGTGPDIYFQGYIETGYGGGIEGGLPKAYNNLVGNPATQTSGYQKLNGQPGGIAPSGSYSGAGGGYYGGYSIKGSDGGGGAGGGSGYIGKVTNYKDIIAKTIPGNLSIINPDGSSTIGRYGNGYARITLLGYLLIRQTPLLKAYDPSSTISFLFSLNSLGVGENAIINRTIGDNEPITILDHPDTGSEYNFTDSFRVPSKTGYLKITYSVTSKSGITTTLDFEILVNIIPQIRLLTELKSNFAKTELGYIDVEVYDDSNVNITLKDENIVYKIIRMNCDFTVNKTRIIFSIPPYEVGTEHILTVFAIDDYNISSNILSASYRITSNTSPDIIIQNNISYYYPYNDVIHIEGIFHDYEVPSTITIYTSIDDKNVLDHYSFTMNKADWYPFSATRKLEKISPGIHTLRIFARDEQQGESNKIIYYFALLPDILKAHYIRSCNFQYQYKIIMALSSFLTISN